MLESAIRSAGVKKMRAEGWVVIVLHGTGFSGSGRADTWACCEGRAVAVEWKQPGKKATPIQLHRIAEFRKAGGISFLCDSSFLVVPTIDKALAGFEIPVEVRG
jgi:hypothetical protein